MCSRWSSAPTPEPPGSARLRRPPDELLDRARYGQYPPGSTFKLVTAIAALNLDPAAEAPHLPLPHAARWPRRQRIPGWNRAIKDDVGDHAHGTLDMERAIAVSCNAYFAQLGVHDVGSKALADTAAKFGISTGDPVKSAPRAAVRRVRAGRGAGLAIQDGARGRGHCGGRTDAGRPMDRQTPAITRTDAPVEVLPPAQAAFIAGAMRRVVTEGTARSAMAGEAIAIAGKTGTAQLDEGLPHAWFTGFAPYDADRRQAPGVCGARGTWRIRRARSRAGSARGDGSGGATGPDLRCLPEETQ